MSKRDYKHSYEKSNGDLVVVFTRKLRGDAGDMPFRTYGEVVIHFFQLLLGWFGVAIVGGTVGTVLQFMTKSSALMSIVCWAFGLLYMWIMYSSMTAAIAEVQAHQASKNAR